MLCVATFYAHFGAVKFSRKLKSMKAPHVLKPVPRKVSSSCGTCVEFEYDEPLELIGEEVDAIYAYDTSGTYIELWAHP